MSSYYFWFSKNIPLQIWKTFSKNHYYHSALCLNPAKYINLGSRKCLLISNLSIEWSCRLWLMLQYCFPSQHAQSSSENYDICALMLGIGSLLVWMGVIRYIGFFKTFNVSSSQIDVCKNIVTTCHFTWSSNRKLGTCCCNLVNRGALIVSRA